MTPAPDSRLLRFFLLITAVGATHMVEQLIFGIEEFDMLRGQVSRWHGLFPQSLHDHGSVVLITIVFLFVSILIYGALRGGTPALLVLLVFGLLGVGEAHHWIEAISERAYDPGLVTSFAFVCVGWLIVRETVKALWPPLKGAGDKNGIDTALRSNL